MQKSNFDELIALKNQEETAIIDIKQHRRMTPKKWNDELFNCIDYYRYTYDFPLEYCVELAVLWMLMKESPENRTTTFRKVINHVRDMAMRYLM